MFQVSETVPLFKEVIVPVSLYQSIQGRYFVGYADNITGAPGANAWAGLYNPPGSGVDLFVNVMTVTNVSGKSFDAEIWFNACFSGNPFRSDLVTPANTAVTPLPIPKTLILQASEVTPTLPTQGTKIDTQAINEETTVVREENGKYIFPPGGSLVVYLNRIESQIIGRVAFGWWEKEAE